MDVKKSTTAKIGSFFGSALAFIFASGITLATAIIIAKILRWLWFF